MNYELVIFDVDGTIADRDSLQLNNEFGNWLFTNASDNSLPKIALATNQGGPACRNAGWGDKYPSYEQVSARLRQILANIKSISGIDVDLNVSWAYITRSGDVITPSGPVQSVLEDEHERGMRKPGPGMIDAAIEKSGVKRNQVLMVGDREEDELAAKNARVDFVWARDFFAQEKGS